MQGITTFKQAEEYLYNVPKFTQKSTPEMTRRFFEFLGCPGESRKIIHVAGTNGKGSVCTYVSKILSAHGYKTALFTSPHLVSMCERFRIDGKLMTEDVFMKYFYRVAESVEKFRHVNENKNYFPTFFEYLFFMAMLWFEDKGVDYIVLETGLGGRLDTTNTIRKPVLCIITKIGLDHTQYLGTTLEEIAGEKAGIIKKNVPLIFYDFDEKVSNVIKNAAIRQNTEFYSVGLADIMDVKIHEKSIDFSCVYEYDKCVHSVQEEFRLPTRALYQTVNAAMALKAAKFLLQEEWNLILVKNTLSQTVWEGRMEEVLPDFFVDGAHNEDGVEAFLQGLLAGDEKEAVLVFGVNADKDYEPMIERLASAGFFKAVVTTRLKGDRSAQSEVLAEQFARYTSVPVIATNCVKNAIEKSRVLSGGNRIYAVGSLYLVGEIKELIKEELL